MSTSPTDAAEPIQKLIATDEAVHWLGRPDWHRVALDIGRVAVPILVIISLSAGFIGVNAAILLNFFGINTGPIAGMVGRLAIVVVALLFMGLYWLFRRQYSRTQYVVTDERLVAIGGLPGQPPTIVEWTDVTDLELAMDPLDRLLDTGTIHVLTAGHRRVTLRYIPDPHSTLNTLESTRAEARDL